MTWLIFCRFYTMMGTLEVKGIIPRLYDALLFQSPRVYSIWGPQIRRSPNRHKLMYFSGSGNSYTMMGTVEEKGIISRLCIALFMHMISSDLFRFPRLGPPNPTDPRQTQTSDSLLFTLQVLVNSIQIMIRRKRNHSTTL